MLTKSTQTRSWRRRATVLLTALALLGACSEVNFDDFSEQFLIRRPTDSLLGAAPSFVTSATGTGSLAFEWQPAPGAERYTLIFGRTESVDSMNLLQGDLESPTLTFPIDAPQIVEVKLTPTDTSANAQRVMVVAHSISASEFDAALDAVGVAKGATTNTVWSVLAHKGSKTVRSVEVQRLVLRRAP